MNHYYPIEIRDSLSINNQLDSKKFEQIHLPNITRSSVLNDLLRHFFPKSSLDSAVISGVDVQSSGLFD